PLVTGVQTCALPISRAPRACADAAPGRARSACGRDRSQRRERRAESPLEVSAALRQERDEILEILRRKALVRRRHHAARVALLRSEERRGGKERRCR